MAQCAQCTRHAGDLRQIETKDVAESEEMGDEFASEFKHEII
jgi:hypothetical protein